MLDDPRVVARRQPRRADAAGEREQLGEPEPAVAADAGIRRLAPGIAANERRRRRHGETPRADRVSRAAGRGRDRSARAATTAAGEQQARSTSGPAGSSHSLSVTPTASGPARSSATALSTPPLSATATRRSASVAADRRTRARWRARRPGAARPRPRPPRGASVRAGPASTPAASASTIVPSLTRSRTAAQSSPRADHRRAPASGQRSPREDGRGAEAPLTAALTPP